MVGFAVGPVGIVGAICGILACVASSILLFCAPQSLEEGGGKFTVVRKVKSHTHAISQTPQPQHTPDRDFST